MSNLRFNQGWLLRGAVIAALATAVAGCGGGGSNSTAMNPPPPPGASPAPASCDAFLEQFGLGFCVKYKAAANSEPTEVAATDIIPVDVTKEPVAGIP